MTDIWIVIKFTFLNRFRSKAFKTSTIIFMIIITIGINLPSIIAALSSNKPTNVGILAMGSNIPAQIQQYFAKQDKPGLKVILIPDAGTLEATEAAAKEEMSKKEIKGYIQLIANEKSGFPDVVYKSEGTINFTVKDKLQGAMQQIKFENVANTIGLTNAQKAQLFTPISIANEQISLNSGNVGLGKTEAQIGLAIGLVYVLVILFFITLQMYGQMIATEVTAEKSSRIMEILISSVAPLKQMFGKVMGMFLLAMAQLILFAAVTVINLKLPNNSHFMALNKIKISDVPASLLVYFFLFFILGFFLYAMLFAAMGSLVSRTEDLSQSVMPVVFLMMAGYFIGIYGITNPTAGFITAMSFVPFFTPMIMFLRIGLVDPALWQILVSFAILLITILAAGWLSAKMYRVGVLMYGKKMSLKEVIKVVSR